jgi:hypothetical protein
MFVKVTTRYKDSQLSAELPTGVILEVSDERAEALIKANVAEGFTFPAAKATKKNNKSEETKVEDPIVEDPAEEVKEPEAEDKWVEPTATETTGE